MRRKVNEYGEKMEYISLPVTQELHTRVRYAAALCDMPQNQWLTCTLEAALRVDIPEGTVAVRNERGRWVMKKGRKKGLGKDGTFTHFARNRAERAAKEAAEAANNKEAEVEAEKPEMVWVPHGANRKLTTEEFELLGPLEQLQMIREGRY